MSSPAQPTRDPGPPGAPPAWRVATTSGATTVLLLRERLSPCAMWCRFCPNALWPSDRTPVDDEGVFEQVLSELQAHLAAVTTPTVTLVSADILAYPRLFDLLDAVVAAGCDVVLNTPGLGLADEGFTRRLAAYPVVLDLTWLSNSADGYARLAGNADAHDRIRAGIAVARAAGIPTKVSVVVTSENVGELDALIERVHDEFGSPRVDLRLFYPDLPAAPPDYFKLFAAYEDIEAALRRLDATGPRSPVEIDLGNAPHCQIDLRGLRHLHVATQLHHGHQNTYGTEGLPVCASCGARDRCVRLHESYARHHRIRRPDNALIADNLTRAEARAQLRGHAVAFEPIAPASPSTPQAQGPMPRGMPSGQVIAVDQGVPGRVGLTPDDEG